MLQSQRATVIAFLRVCVVYAAYRIVIRGRILPSAKKESKKGRKKQTIIQDKRG